jgi:hypothetical protein
MPTGRYVKLICAMSAKDSFWILLFFLISAFLFQNISIMQDYTQLGFFVLLSLGFAFIDEKISTKMGRWEYAPSMPTVFGVGITPLLEIAVTGILTFLIVFKNLLLYVLSRAFIYTIRRLFITTFYNSNKSR